MDGLTQNSKPKNKFLRIECWGIVPNGDVYTAPERQSFSLKGFVFNHPRFPDGDDITTSAIKSVSGTIEEVLVYTTSGSVYKLGDPDPRYEKQFPNAKERILKNGIKS